MGIQFHPTQDLLFILRSGDIFCRLACALYKKVDCHLLGKGLEYGIHKIIFFLELCKSLHIKRSLLFQVSDLLVWPENDLNRKHALIVLRTVIALEKHARKSGWDGPSMDLKPVAKDSLGVSSRDTMMLVNNSSISSEFAPPVPSNSNLFPPVPSKVQEQKTQSLFNTGVDSISSRASLASKPSREFQAQPANDPPEPVSKQSRFKLEPPPDIEPKNTSRFKLEPAIDLGSDSFSQPAHFEGNTYTTEFMPQSSSLDPLPPSELESMPPVLPPIEQHEAYHFQDSSDEENSDVMGSSAASHSKNMMAALTFNELVEEDINGSSPELIQGDQSTPKLRESSPPESSPGNGTFQENMRKKILAEAIEERLIMREKAVNDFIQEEVCDSTDL